jgi:hypothetical protein
MKLTITAVIAFIVLCLSCLAGDSVDKTVEVRLKLSPTISDKPLTGRVYVLVRLDIYSKPLEGPSLSESDPFFALDVKNWKPGEEITITNDALGYPYPINALPVRSCLVQVVLDTNTIERNFGDAPTFIPGKIFSGIETLIIQDKKKNSISIELDRKSGGIEIEETDFIKDFQVKSTLLSSFYKRPVAIKAAVILPPTYYENQNRKYGTVFVMPGFGSRYTVAFRDDFQIGRYGMNKGGL